MFNISLSRFSGGARNPLHVRAIYRIPVFLVLTIPRLLVALLPYTIFSLFHALTFTRTTLMPRFLPPSPAATQGGAPQPHPLAKQLQAWVKGMRC